MKKKNNMMSLLNAKVNYVMEIMEPYYRTYFSKNPNLKSIHKLSEGRDCIRRDSSPYSPYIPIARISSIP